MFTQVRYEHMVAFDCQMMDSMIAIRHPSTYFVIHRGRILINPTWYEPDVDPNWCKPGVDKAHLMLIAHDLQRTQGRRAVIFGMSTACAKVDGGR